MRKTIAIALGITVLSGWAGRLAADAPAAATAIVRPLLAQGYLGAEGTPDGLALIPALPASGSGAATEDARAEAAALALRGTPRWDLARKDADLRSPAATGTFSCAAGRVIDAQATPRTDALLRRTLSDFARVSVTAKQHYARKRPFESNGQPICTPDDEAGLRGNASYPSGHATIGYGWALVLADLLPARRAALVARGEAFGDSRRVCNVHHASDVAAGRALAAPVLQRLRADLSFRADLAAAKAELRRIKPVKPDCVAENAALAFHLKDVR